MTWQERLEAALDALGDGDAERRSFAQANSDLLARALAGAPVDGGAAKDVGGRIVVNMPSAHIPAFARSGERYKNAYDLDADRARAGEPPQAVSTKRLAVDQALERVHGRHPADIYFAAVEFNGCGIGFYGDFCLVLRDDVTAETYSVLDRNSYDLIREPLRSAIEQAPDPDQARADHALNMSGTLSADLAAMAGIKVLESRRPVLRLMTTGMVSEGVLDDEDYIEVLRPASFTVDDVAEVRLTPGEIAAEERVRSRSISGQPPSHAELQWRQRRRTAEELLSALGVPVRAVTTAGRTKG